ncbi:MAG: hypothetical protein WBA12_04635, partial [Catalinimonas sp.]
MCFFSSFRRSVGRWPGLLAVVLICAPGGTGYAQEPCAQNFYVEEGLPPTEIYDLHQDGTRGYLWLATDDGLLRYDGNRFVPMRAEPAMGLAVSFLHEDPQGRIWCANFAGQVGYVAGDSLKLYLDVSDQVSNFPELFMTAAGELFIVTDRDIVRVNTATMRYRRQAPRLQAGRTEVLPSKLIIGAETPEGFLYGGSEQTNGLLTHAFELRPLPQPTPRVSMPPRSYFKSSRRVYQADDLFAIDRSAIDTLTDHPVIDTTAVLTVVRGQVRQIAFDGKKALVATSAGLYYYPEGLEQPTRHHWFRSENVSDVLVDDNGYYWVSTIDNGLYLVRNPAVRLFDTRGPLSHNSVQLIHPYGGDLYVGQKDGTLSRLHEGERAEVTFVHRKLDARPYDLGLGAYVFGNRALRLRGGNVESWFSLGAVKNALWLNDYLLVASYNRVVLLDIDVGGTSAAPFARQSVLPFARATSAREVRY